MTQCSHDFIKITDEAKPNMRVACVVCLYCGQVRYVSDEGHVTIFKERGEVKNATHETNHKG